MKNRKAKRKYKGNYVSRNNKSNNKSIIKLFKRFKQLLFGAKFVYTLIKLYLEFC